MIRKFWASKTSFAPLQSPFPAIHLALASSVLLFCAAHASAGQAHLTWDAVSAPNLAGYRLYYSLTPSSYTTYIDVGLQTTAAMTGLTAGKTYYFVVTAYDTAGDESGASNTASVTISSNTTSAVNRDFNGDGKADILLQNAAGVLYELLLNGTTIIGQHALTGLGTVWKLVGVGDFNGDGKADILLQHTSGVLYEWLLNGPTVIGQGSPGSIGTVWQVK